MANTATPSSDVKNIAENVPTPQSDVKKDSLGLQENQENRENDASHTRQSEEKNQKTNTATSNAMEKEISVKELPKHSSLGANTVTSTQVAPPLPSDSGFSWGGYFQSIGILLFLLAALWLLVWFIRKYGRFNFIPRPGDFPHGGLRLEAQLPLGPKKGLAVVRFLDKRLLVGITEQQITLLQEVKDNDESMDFSKIMDDIHKQESS